MKTKSIEKNRIENEMKSMGTTFTPRFRWPVTPLIKKWHIKKFQWKVHLKIGQKSPFKIGTKNHVRIGQNSLSKIGN